MKQSQKFNPKEAAAKSLLNAGARVSAGDDSHSQTTEEIESELRLLGDFYKDKTVVTLPLTLPSKIIDLFKYQYGAIDQNIDRISSILANALMSNINTRRANLFNEPPIPTPRELILAKLDVLSKYYRSKGFSEQEIDKELEDIVALSQQAAFNSLPTQETKDKFLNTQAIKKIGNIKRSQPVKR